MQQHLATLLIRPIAFHPSLAKLFGGINEAIYWQQLHYWGDKGGREDGFIYKTKEDIERETTLTRYQQDPVRKKLEKLGVLEVKNIKAGSAPTLHYRVNVAQVMALLEKQEKENLKNPISAKSTNGKVHNALMEKCKKHLSSYTESTTESTTDIAGSGNPTPAKGSVPVKKKKKTHNPLGTEIIKVFESIDSQNKTYYGNTTQREACDFLIKEYGLGKVLEVVQELLPTTNKRPRYEFPHISTPYQLKTNWTKLVDSSFVKNNEQTADVAFTS